MHKTGECFTVKLRNYIFTEHKYKNLQNFKKCHSTNFITVLITLCNQAKSNRFLLYFVTMLNAV